jgi:hypothetical protein
MGLKRGTPQRLTTWTCWRKYGAKMPLRHAAGLAEPGEKEARAHPQIVDIRRRERSYPPIMNKEKTSEKRARGLYDYSSAFYAKR